MTLQERFAPLIEQLVAAGIPLSLARREFDEAYISVAVQSCRGNVAAAARKIGVHRNTVHNKLHTEYVRTVRIAAGESA